MQQSKININDFKHWLWVITFFSVAKKGPYNHYFNTQTFFTIIYLIKKSKTNITLDDSETKFWFNNQLVNSLTQETDIFEGDNLPDISFEDYALQNGLGNEYKYIV